MRTSLVDQVVNNPPVNTGDPGLIPGPGRSHKPWSNQACGPQPHSATREATTRRSLHTTKESSACSLPLDKAHVRQQRPSTAETETK